MKRLIRISDGRNCGEYADDHQPPDGSEEGMGLVGITLILDPDSADGSLIQSRGEPTYRWEQVPQSEIDEAAKKDRIRSIDSLLKSLDSRRIRPIAEGDSAKLNELNAQVLELRKERQSLTQ